MEQYISAFIDAKLAAGRQYSTITFYKIILDQLPPFVDTWPPTPNHLKRFFLHKRKTCNETSVNTAHKAINSFLNWCEREKLITDNPLNQMDRPRQPHPLPKIVSQETMRRLFQTIQRAANENNKLAIRDLALFRLAYDTGCRATELSRLKIENLDLPYGSVLVEEGKGQRDRVVYFGRKCTSALADWLVIHPGCSWMFPNRCRTRIQPLGRRGILHAAKKWSNEAGITGFTVHKIRHSYATHALRRGIDLRHIQHQLGHSSIKTTAIYLAIEDADRRRAHRELAPGDAV